MKSERSRTFERLVCHGALPSHDKESCKASGVILHSAWWSGLRALERDTPALTDGFLTAFCRYPQLHSLRVASPRLTDHGAAILSDVTTFFDSMRELEVEAHLLSPKGWGWIARGALATTRQIRRPCSYFLRHARRVFVVSLRSSLSPGA